MKPTYHETLESKLRTLAADAETARQTEDNEYRERIHLGMREAFEVAANLVRDTATLAPSSEPVAWAMPLAGAMFKPMAYHIIAEPREGFRPLVFGDTHPASSEAACQHRIADGRNPIVTSGYLCIDCGALFAAADHDKPRASSEAQAGQTQAPQQDHVTPPTRGTGSQHGASESVITGALLERLIDDHTDRDFGLIVEPFARAIEAAVAGQFRAQGGNTNDKAAAQAVPEGFTIVPLEPTREMVQACNVKFMPSIALPFFVAAYKTMISAAPKVPAQAKDKP